PESFQCPLAFSRPSDQYSSIGFMHWFVLMFDSVWPRYQEAQMTLRARHAIVRLVAVGLSVIALPQSMLAQGDPLELQARAIRRLDGFVETFRKTGDMRSRLPDLAQAEAELSASNQMLVARGDWSALALGLIKQGHVYRMQGQWQASIPFYSQAAEAA